MPTGLSAAADPVACCRRFGPFVFTAHAVSGVCRKRDIGRRGGRTLPRCLVSLQVLSPEIPQAIRAPTLVSPGADVTRELCRDRLWIPRRRAPGKILALRSWQGPQCGRPRRSGTESPLRCHRQAPHRRTFLPIDRPVRHSARKTRRLVDRTFRLPFTGSPAQGQPPHRTYRPRVIFTLTRQNNPPLAERLQQAEKRQNVMDVAS